MTIVEITTGARLHFGPLSVEAPAGGKFGGVGVMIDTPGIALSARVAQEDRVFSDDTVVTRVLEFLKRIRSSDTQPAAPDCEVTVSRMIPAHRGFGSGTQLGLAVAKAVAVLAGESAPTMETLARRVGRGLRSAIGLHGFARGGFLVDGGRRDASRLGTLVSRIDFPTDWRFVLGAPHDVTGLSGTAEKSAFAEQPPMPRALTAELCRIVLMDWLPAVIEADFVRCSAAMSEFGNSVGGFFSPVQGGVFAHPKMAQWARQLDQRGVKGVAQTSWGPTIAALCSSEAAAQQLCSDFSGDSGWRDCRFSVVAPRNRGADVRIE